MEHKKIKIMIVVGFLFAFLVFISAPVFAYDSTEVEYDTFYQNPDYPNSSSQRYILFDETPLTSNFYNIADTITVGYSLNTLVPYYADGDHVSFFSSFMVTVPRINFQGSDNRWTGDYSLYCGPWNYKTGLLYSEGLQSQLLFSLRDLVYNNYSVMQKSGTFYWQGIADCSFKALIYHGGSTTFQSSSAEYESFFINIQFDLNITQSLELLPFSICVYQNVVAPGSTSFYRLDAKPFFRINDTSMYGLLEDIESALSNIDFSGLEGLSQLSTITQNIYNQSIHNGNVLESIYDDGGVDPDVTRWGEEASQFESVVSNYHELESQMLGTVTDFTFPDAPNQTAMGNVFNMFFGNELILALILATLTVTIAMLILF